MYIITLSKNATNTWKLETVFFLFCFFVLYFKKSLLFSIVADVGGTHWSLSCRTSEVTSNKISISIVCLKKKLKLCTISRNDELLPPIQHLNKSSSSKVHEQTDKLRADRNEPILDFSSFSISLCVRARASAFVSVCVCLCHRRHQLAFAFNREKVFFRRLGRTDVWPSWCWTVGGWCARMRSQSNYVKGVTRFPFGLF